MALRTIHKLIALPLFLTLSAFAQDTIVLKNGDVLSGQILKEGDDLVYFRSSAFGAVSLQTKDIKEIRFQTAQHGEIATEPATTVREATTMAAPDPSEFVGPLPQKQAEKDPSHWSGQTGLSLAMRESVKSNASGITGKDKSETYRFYGNVGWNSESNELLWDWTYRYSRDEYETQEDFFNVTQKYTRDFEENYYATAKTMYQQDYRRRINHEYLQTAEMGIKWISMPYLELSTSAGGGYHQYERIKYNESTQKDEKLNITQPKFIFDESLRWKIINSLTLLQKYTHLGNMTDYHSVFSAGLENNLIRDIFLRLEYRLDRDTEVYYDDHGYYDKALLTSLLYKF